MPAYDLNLYDQSPLPMFRKPKPVDELQMWRERAERAETLLQTREEWAEDRRLELLHENVDLKIKNCRLYDEVKDLLATIANLEAVYSANLHKAISGTPTPHPLGGLMNAYNAHQAALSPQAAGKNSRLSDYWR